jgi:hypothetical protein
LSLSEIPYKFISLNETIKCLINQVVSKV